MINTTQQPVAYQINVEHTGFSAGPLKLPLKELWKREFGEREFVGLPIVANGIVVVTAGHNLYALDEKTGKKLWSRRAPRATWWTGPAYDNGTIFVNPLFTYNTNDPGMYAFDERTGKKLWSSLAPGRYAFDHPPAAAYGTVYAGASGDGGTLYVYDESTGKRRWTAAVPDGAESSPVVTRNGIFVSYFCLITYDFAPSDGTLIWHFYGSCKGGGGGGPPILYDSLLSANANSGQTGPGGTILNAKDST